MPRPDARWLLVGVLITLTCGCANGERARTYPNDFYGRPTTIAAQSEADAESPEGGGVTGVWEGTSISNCWFISVNNPDRCEAMQNITLTMFQHGTTVTGRYTCAYGNRVCRNMDEYGVIRTGTLKQDRLMMRVMLEDGSTCFFTGMRRKSVIEGDYFCGGGGVVEKGIFHTQRSY